MGGRWLGTLRWRCRNHLRGSSKGFFRVTPIKHSGPTSKDCPACQAEAVIKKAATLKKLQKLKVEVMSADENAPEEAV